MTTHADWNEAEASALIEGRRAEKGAMLPILHDLQHRFGFIPDAAIPLIAAALNVSKAETVGVVSFYPHFRRAAPHAPVLQLCRAESCQAAGCENLVAHLQSRHGLTPDAHDGGGAVEVETVYCLGHCAASPAAMLDGEPMARLTAERLDSLLASPLPGPPPQGGREFTAPAVSPAGATAPRVFVPRDSTALALGADKVAEAFATAGANVIRTGSRGLFWLEPLVEIERDGVRYGYGPLTPEDAEAVLAGGDHRKALGAVEDIPYLKQQQRLLYARCGVTDPLSLDAYVAHGGGKGLRRSIAIGGAATIKDVLDSGLRGRGGAGFPTGIKWRTVAGVAAEQKYVVCNADEGDSGTFADRMLMEGDPFLLIEGMTIAALAVGADEGYIYIRSEYPHAFATMQAAIEIARKAHWLGADVLGSGKAFDLHARLGAGAYICGEETSLLESLEGKRGLVRAKPPLPALQGLFGKPSVINNVLSFASTPWILAEGAAAYAAYGVGRSLGSQPFQLAGDIKYGGLVELAFGVTIRRLVEDFGGGTRSGRPVRAVQVGGPLGAYFPENLLDTPLTYEDMAAAKGMLGHGGIVVFDDSVDMAAQARFAMKFCAAESCGKCTPCRIGSTRGVETVDKIVAGERREANVALLRDLCETMLDGSLCALGGLTPFPVLSALDHFPEDFNRSPQRQAAE